MKNIQRGLVHKAVLLLTLLIATGASAQTTVIVTGTGKAENRDFQRLRAHALVRKAENVFPPSEQKALLQMGRPILAQSLKVTVDSDERAAELQSWSNREKLNLEFEKTEIAIGLDTVGSRDLFLQHQWGVENTGQPQTIALDDLTSLVIAGKIGEDIGVKKAPKENMDPSRTVTVAVLDTGVHYAHPDLDGRFVEKPAECRDLVAYTKCKKEANDTKACDEKYATKDNDGNGYPLDCSGWNTTVQGLLSLTGIYGEPDAADANGHGTHVAGIIAAKADANGVRGVAQNVRILPVKVLASSPTSPVTPRATEPQGDGDSETFPSPKEEDLKAKGFADFIARGVLYAVRSKADIINMSLGWPAGVDSNLMRQMVELAQAKGILVVAAAGNDATDALIRPCVYPGVICVGSHSSDGAVSHFSNYGSGVDIAAPGLNVLSTFPVGVITNGRPLRPIIFTESQGYDIKSGTSMAAPHISGLLARLLNAGLKPQEAYARMMAGARPHQPAAYRSADTATRFTLSGNADLAGALSARPQPLILPVEKLPLTITWDRKASQLPLTIPLKNFWSTAGSVTVDVTLRSRIPGPADAQLERSTWTFNAWEAGATKELKTALRVLNRRLDSEYALDLVIRPSGHAPQKRTVQTEISVVLSPDFKDDNVQRISVLGAETLRGASLRTVTSLDGRPQQDYVAIGAEGRDMKLTLVRDNGGRYTTDASAVLPAQSGELMLVQRTDVNHDQSSDYVFIFRLRPTGDSRAPTFSFHFFDAQMRPLQIKLNAVSDSNIIFDNQVSVLSERFQWMNLGATRVPAWVARGTTPELEKPAFDPWNPNPVDFSDIKVFYLSPEGLRTVQVPEEYFVIEMLSLSEDQTVRGRIPVLLGKGDQYKVDYAVGEVVNGEIQNLTPLTLERYRRLRGTSLVNITPIDRNQSRRGTAFVDSGTRATQRVTSLVDDVSRDGIVDAILDTTLRPILPTDSVTSVAGVFLGEKRRSVFALTIYDMQFHDLQSGARAATSLKRFSFMPIAFFFRFFTPVVVEDTNQRRGDRLPGIYVPAGLGLSQSLDVMVPRYTSSGDLLGLVRPAGLRLDVARGCESLANPIPASSDEPTMVMFFCGDRFLKVPMEY